MCNNKVVATCARTVAAEGRAYLLVVTLIPWCGNKTSNVGGWSKIGIEVLLQRNSSVRFLCLYRPSTKYLPVGSNVTSMQEGVVGRITTQEGAGKLLKSVNSTPDTV